MFIKGVNLGNWLVLEKWMSPHLAAGQYVVFHDAFRLKDWKEFLTREEYKGRVILDTHQYLMVAEAYGCPQTLTGYINS